MDIPTNLKHKPVIVVDDYDKVNGREACKGETSALSLGLAQWNERNIMDISAKVWRRSNDRWSRLSEELPLHKVIDLAILIVEAKKYLANSYVHKGGFDHDNPIIDRIGIQGEAMTARICVENEKIEGDIELFNAALAKDDELLSERLRILKRLLEDY